MKRLVCCLDGTWNDDVKASARTNIVKLHRSVLVADTSGVGQVSEYIVGIATTEGQRAQFLRGAIGLEVRDRIWRGYQFLIDNYEPGDEIYLFGFSRGAFEARSLASLIAIFGIPRRDGAFALDDAWKLYRKPEKRRDFDKVAMLTAECHYPVRIACVGVWDTVGNLGNPLFRGGLINRRFQFHDMRLHDTIDNAFQALAIDEKRAPFNPIFFTLPKSAALPKHQHVEQTWFAGTHADVGGGWDVSGLSDISLLWMAERVTEKTELALDIDRLRMTTQPDPLALQHDSATGRIFVLDRLIPYVRFIQQAKDCLPLLRRAFFGYWRTDYLRDDVSLNESIHESALTRLGRRVGVEVAATTIRQNYLPRNLIAAVGPPTEIEASEPEPESKSEQESVPESAIAMAPVASAAHEPEAVKAEPQPFARNEPPETAKPTAHDPEPAKPPPERGAGPPLAAATAAAMATAVAYRTPSLTTAKNPQQPIATKPTGPAVTIEKQDTALTGPAAETGPSRIRIVTVHGTGAGGESDKGTGWWQLDSPFQKKLAAYVDLSDQNVDVVPFHWGVGPNSETERRAAGKRLFAQLREYDTQGIDYHLVGHSHGGSVIYDALLHSAARNEPLARLQNWFTIGTPFLDYKPNGFLFSRLNIWGQLIYVTAIASLLFAIGLVASHLFDLPFGQVVKGALGDNATRIFYVPVLTFLLTYFVISYGLLFLTERLTKRWASDKQKHRTRDLYERKWVGFWHRDDEAISALSNVGSLRRAIVPSNFLVPLFSLIPLIATIIGIGYLFSAAAHTLTPDNPTASDFFGKLGQSAIKVEDMNLTFDTLLKTAWELIQVVVVIMGPLLGIYLLVTSAAIGVSRLLAHIIGRPAAAGIDRLVWSSVRQRAWGNDRRGEYVAKVSNHPPQFDARYVALPKTVADRIANLSESQASETLRRAREMLGMSTDSKSMGDIGNDLSAQLTWKELIHTCYFDIDEFVRVLAAGLRAGGVPPARGFKGSTTDADTWLADINAPVPATPA